MPHPPTNIHAARRKRAPKYNKGDSQDNSASKTQKQQTKLQMENRERAYVAASRRADRSLEARYQSALMASDVHEKRTGRALRITHKTVHEEEMYEEVDQDLLPPDCSQPSPGGGGGGSGYRRRAQSQTDALIAALIARRAGVPNLWEPNNHYTADSDSNSAAWAAQTPFVPDGNCCAVGPHSGPTSGQDAVASGDSYDNYTFFSAPLDPCAVMSLPRTTETVSVSGLAEPAALPDLMSPAQTPSSDSSIADYFCYSTIYEVNLGLSESFQSSQGLSTLRFQDFLKDADGPGSFGFHSRVDS